ncbi:MAG TPA: TRAP transporter fused permease subunit [Alphaproteobacteria bacterium]
MAGTDIGRYWYVGANAIAAAAFIVLAAALAFNLGSLLGIAYYEEQAFALAVGLGLFLTYHRPADAKTGRGAVRAGIESVIGWALLAATVAFAWDFENYTLAIVQQPPEIVIGGTLLLIALLEAVRRVAGFSLVAVIVLILAYTLFGRYLPSDFAAPETEFGATIAYVVGDANAILGAPVAVAVIVVIPFIFMGEVLRLSNGSTFFTDLAMALVGRSTGGSAKVAVISSGLVGMVSGSAVGNVMTAGVITIPLMRNSGYTAVKAGAIESVASTGGQLMPPVMGAAAFLMAEFLQIPYSAVVIAAIIPALLYYGQLFLAVHLIAKRDGIAGVAVDAARARGILRRGWFFLAGLAALLLMLLSGQWRPESAAFLAAVFFALCGVTIGYDGTRMALRHCLSALVGAGRGSVDIVVISAAAGIVVGLLNVSGLSFSLSVFLIDLAGSNAFLLLVYTAVVSILLGMGMPTTGVYVLLATIVAPALVQLGILDLGAHFFIFYFGMMSMITPPVAMAAFAAASLAGTDPMKTGWNAVALAWPAFVLPFLLTSTPELLAIGPVPLVLAEAFAAAVGIAAITVAAYGYCGRRLGIQARAILMPAGAFCLLSFLPGDVVFGLRMAVALVLMLWMTGILSGRGAALAPAALRPAPVPVEEREGEGRLLARGQARPD